MGCMWYLESGASFHMKGNRDLFSDLEEKDLQQNIKFGDDRRYSATDISTITFQRDFDPPLIMTYALYVPGLKNNLVSIELLEDYRYDVIFRKGNVFLRHIATRQVK